MCVGAIELRANEDVRARLIHAIVQDNPLFGIKFV